MIVSDYSQMDRILREERQYLLNICKKIKKAGCNVLLVQKSILRYMMNARASPLVSYPLSLFLPTSSLFFLSTLPLPRTYSLLFLQSYPLLSYPPPLYSFPHLNGLFLPSPPLFLQSYPLPPVTSVIFNLILFPLSPHFTQILPSPPLPLFSPPPLPFSHPPPPSPLVFLTHLSPLPSLWVLRDAVNDMALHFLAKLKILVVRDVEREDIEFISRVRYVHGAWDKST